ncbi:hypothetical protein [Oricola nitratireducens]|jgi:hypothetical protein|uniref:hypothetical protein n=1 Tax=Oricola nitratireducens TaxID=2775868 RepID=UPI001866D36E|nr:hypothetical protein [Oricola nitratireducens]
MAASANSIVTIVSRARRPWTGRESPARRQTIESRDLDCAPPESSEGKLMEVIKFVVFAIGLSVGGMLAYGAFRFNSERERPEADGQKRRRAKEVQQRIAA